MPRKAVHQNTPGAGEPARCPWCSAPLTSVDEARCPSCHAALRDDGDEDVPGVTKVDHEGLLRRSRKPTPRPSGLMGWISGSDDLGGSPASPDTFSPPDDAVRREMIRMELASLEVRVEAERAALEAELGVAAANRQATPSVPGDAPDAPDVPGDTSATETARAQDPASPKSEDPLPPSA